jgi:hypothetical protein
VTASAREHLTLQARDDSLTKPLRIPYAYETMASMGSRLALIAMRVVEVMFFTGLVGCVSTVIISWFQVGRDSFSPK